MKSWSFSGIQDDLTSGPGGGQIALSTSYAAQQQILCVAAESMVSSPVDHYQYRKRTINLLSLGTKIAGLARQRRRWETLLRSMPRTQSLARDFDPAFDRLTEVTGFGSNPGALRMFKYIPADP